VNDDRDVGGGGGGVTLLLSSRLPNSSSTYFSAPPHNSLVQVDAVARLPPRKINGIRNPHPIMPTEFAPTTGQTAVILVG
jgi:hypothetical protein